MPEQCKVLTVGSFYFKIGMILPLPIDLPVCLGLECWREAAWNERLFSVAPRRTVQPSGVMELRAHQTGDIWLDRSSLSEVNLEPSKLKCKIRPIGSASMRHGAVAWRLRGHRMALYSSPCSSALHALFFPVTWHDNDLAIGTANVRQKFLVTFHHYLCWRLTPVLRMCGWLWSPN